jgi:hypothetical protein
MHGCQAAPDDVEAEVADGPGRAVVVALSDGAVSLRPVAAADLEVGHYVRPGEPGA